LQGDAELHSDMTCLMSCILVSGLPNSGYSAGNLAHCRTQQHSTLRHVEEPFRCLLIGDDSKKSACSLKQKRWLFDKLYPTLNKILQTFWNSFYELISESFSY